MPERIIVLRRGNALVGADQRSQDVIAKLAHGKPLAADLVQARNLGLHRKAFALAQLAFDYWEPETLVSSVERRTVGELYKFLVANGTDRDSVRELSAQFLRHLDESRQSVEAEKSFEGFREFITVEAGYYRVVHTPRGPKKEPKSWSFASMDDGDFQEFYKDLFNVCWKVSLMVSFDNEDEAEKAVEQLLSFT